MVIKGGGQIDKQAIQKNKHGQYFTYPTWEK